MRMRVRVTRECVDARNERNAGAFIAHERNGKGVEGRDKETH